MGICCTKLRTTDAHMRTTNDLIAFVASFSRLRIVKPTEPGNGLAGSEIPRIGIRSVSFGSAYHLWTIVASRTPLQDSSAILTTANDLLHLPLLCVFRQRTRLPWHSIP
jgi:hypothetical protein